MTTTYDRIIARAEQSQLDRTRNELFFALTHIEADHEALKKLWDLHSPGPMSSTGLQFCTHDGFVHPCVTRRILLGEEV